MPGNPARRSPAVAIALVWMCAACGGGGSSPTTPTSPTPSPPVADVCGALGATAIVNGTACASAASAVVLLNMRDDDGFALGQCSGTIIAPRAILTAAHCIDDNPDIVRVWLGSGAEITASSYRGHPDYNGNSGNSPDVGVIFVSEDLARTPVPLLTSRDARVQESAVIAGWGRDQQSVGATLRAGATTISAVRSMVIETLYNAATSAICSGDSGGPILLSEGGRWAIGGVSSATSVAVCTTGTNFYINMRNPTVRSFVVAQVPDAQQR